MKVVYEDNHLLVVSKLPGEIVHADKTGDPSLEDMVALYLKKKYNKPWYTGSIDRWADWSFLPKPARLLHA